MTGPAPVSFQQSTSRHRSLLVVGVAYALALGVALVMGSTLQGRSPIVVAALADLAATLVVFGFSVRYGNSSLYDPYWSVAPVPIAVYWASCAPSGLDGHALLVLVLVTAWGVRLTANWVARWHGLQDEDFRYLEIRRKAGRLYWPASLLSIHLLPTAWVFLGLLPTWPALSSGGRPLGPLDLVALAVTAGAIAIEAIADLQLRRFLRRRRDPSAVLDQGLWRLSRHPNYFGEISFWWGLWLFGLAADPGWAGWTVVGPLSITLLFLLVSIPWMDRRMLSRHPGWAAQMKATSALVPWPRRRLALVVIALGALHSGGSTAAADAPDLAALRQRYAGEYRFCGGDAERAMVPAAVERSVDGMFFIARGIAYNRLLKTCEICSSYTLGFGGGNISVAGPCQVSDVSPDDGREVDHRTKLGDTSKLSQRFVGETLVQDFRAEDGSRQVVWTLQPDGETLRVRMVITSKHLPHAVDYTLIYRRKNGPPSMPAPPPTGR